MMICMRTVRGFGCGNGMASDPRENPPDGTGRRNRCSKRRNVLGVNAWLQEFPELVPICLFRGAWQRQKKAPEKKLRFGGSRIGGVICCPIREAKIEILARRDSSHEEQKQAHDCDS